MRKTVLFRAPALSLSGYGTHARQIFRWLKDRDIDLTVDLTPWGITSWHVNPDAEGGLIGEIMKRTGNPKKTPDVTISLQLPNEWQPVSGAINVGMSAIVETDRCLPAWVDACNRMDRVIVPSRFSESVLRASGKLTVDTRVVHESFPDEILKIDTGLELPEVKTPVNFLMVGQVTGMKPDLDRKNLFYAVKWFCEEFSGRNDVSLIIKTNLGTNSSYHRNQLNSIFGAVLKEVRKGNQFPLVHLVNGEMTTQEMAQLYRSKKIKALITLTRGEGFGLPILEAAASDLPVICVDWSGHMDFMGLGKHISIQHSLVEIPQERVDGSIFIKGSKWAQANEADFKKKVRKFYASYETPRKWAIDLGKTVREKFSFDAIAAQYDKELGDLV